MVCLFLHFYQPSNQLPQVFRDVVKSCYAPLIKVIKDNKKLNLTLNFPLALLEQLDRLGYRDLIADIRLLVDQNRVELTGTAAYHPLLSRLPESMVCRQIMLNEMAYGYYFGADKDFEGEDCYMIRDVRGFFPPEMAVQPNLPPILDDMGYEWMLMDEYSLPDQFRDRHRNGMFYTLSGCSTKLLVRNRGLSNLLAFNREFDVSGVANDLIKNGDGAILALDAETFGHHYRDGVGFFDNLTIELGRSGVEFSTISQAIKYMEEKSLVELLESTWSTVDSEIYPMWVNKECPVNVSLWELFKFLHDQDDILANLTEYEGDSSRRLSGNAEIPEPFWLDRRGNNKRSVQALNVLKSEQSDAFWWSTGVEVAGKKNLSRYMIVSTLEYYKGCAGLFGNRAPELLELVQKVEEKASTLE